MFLAAAVCSGVYGTGGAERSAGLGVLVVRSKVRGAALAYVSAGFIHFPLVNGFMADSSGQYLPAEVAGGALGFHQPAAGGIAGSLYLRKFVSGAGSGPETAPAMGTDRGVISAVVPPVSASMAAAVSKHRGSGGGSYHDAQGERHDTFHYNASFLMAEMRIMNNISIAIANE